MATRSRIVGLDFLRFFSLLLVVFEHADGSEQYLNHSLGVDVGGLGVSFFILLSGLSLSIGSLKEPSYVKFIFKRVKSILPDYWLAYLAVAFALVCFTDYDIMQFSLGAYLFTFLGLDGYAATQFKTPYLIGEWFVGFILLTYLFAKPLYVVLKKYPILTILGTFIISALSLKYLGSLALDCKLFNKMPPWNVSSRIFEFCVGMVLWLWVMPSRKMLDKLAVLSLLWIFIVQVVLRLPVSTFNIVGITSCVSIFIIILALVTKIDNNNAWGGCERAIAFLGKYSFVAFLFHHQILTIIYGRIHVTSMTPTLALVLTIVTVVLSYCASYLFVQVISECKKIGRSLTYWSSL